MQDNLPLLEHDYKTIQSLLTKIDTSLQQIKSRSISSLHTKLSARIVTPTQLAAFSELPGVLLNWINDHQHKSEPLMKVLHILLEVSETEKGARLLKEYEALEFLEGFRKYIRTHENNTEVRKRVIKEYVGRIDRVIRNILPFGRKQSDNKAQQQYEEHQPENDPGRINSTNALQQTLQKQPSLPLQSKIPTKFCQSLQFSIPRQQLDQPLQKQIFDLTVQLKYGNKRIQFQTLRMIKEFISVNSCEFWRNKTELIQQLGKYVEEGVYANEAVEILRVMLEGLMRQEKRLRTWEMRSIKGGEEKTLKFLFPMKQSVVNSPYSQPIMEVLRKGFKKEWLDWLVLVRAEWASDYIIEMLKQVPKKYLIQRRQSVVGLTQLLLNCNRFDSDLFGQELLQSQQLKDHQQKNQMKEGYRRIKQYDGGHFDPGKLLHEFPRLMSNLSEGLPGLGYSPRLVSVYLDTIIYVSIASFRQQPLKEHFQPLLGMILQISCHLTRSVRVKLYQLLLQRCYLQSSISYLSQQYTVSQLTLSLLCQPRILLPLTSCCLNQPQSTLFMLQILKLLYIHHRQDVHQGFVRIAPLLHILTLSADKKIASLSKQIMEKLRDEELRAVEVMGMFGRDPKGRERACARVLGQEQGDLVEDFVGESKRNIKLKPITVDEDSIINYINIAGNNVLEPSVRVSAISELIQLLERCEITQVVVNRLQALNSGLIKEAAKMNTDNILLQFILSLNVCLVLKPYRCRLFDNINLLINWLRKPLSFMLKHKILSILYLYSFRNPFTLNDPQIRLHWAYCSDKFIPFVEIPEKIERLDIDVTPEEDLKKNQQQQPQLKQQKDIETFTKFLLGTISEPRDQQNLLQLKFDEMNPLIGKCLAANTPNSSLSPIRTIFQIYALHPTQFKPLTPEFMAHSVPSLINILNREGNSIYFDMDAVSIMRVIGVGGEATSGIQQHQNQKCIAAIYEHPSQAIKLQLFTFVKQPSANLIQQVVRQLPTATEGVVRKTYRSLLQKLKPCQGQLLNHDITRLSLTNSLLKSLQTCNPHLQLGSLQLLLQLTSPTLLSEHPTLYNLVLQTVIKGDCCAIVMVAALKVLRKMIKFDGEGNLQRVQHLGVVEKVLRWVGDVEMTNMVKAAALGVLNQVIRTPLIQRYQVVDEVVRVIGIVARQNNKEDYVDYCVVICEACNALCLLGQSDSRLAQLLLSSTLLLSDLLSLIQSVKALVSTHHSTSIIPKTLSTISQLLYFISLQQDLFIFHLNRLLSDSPNLNIFSQFSELMPLSDLPYLKFISRLITIWYKGHASLERDDLGAKILDYFEQNTQLAYSLLAVSTSAKVRFVTSGSFDKVIGRALMMVDGVFVDEIKKKTGIEKKKEDNIAASRLSRASNVTTGAAAAGNLSQILLLLKSFFHKCSTNTVEISLPNQNVLILIQKLFTLTSNPKRSSQFTELKKTISNLCSNPSFEKDIFTYLMDPKHSFILQLINTCLRADTFTTVFKQSIDILKIFSSHSEVRTVVYRNRLISELNTKVIRAFDSKGNGQLDPTKAKFIEQVVKYQLFISAYKDSHTKIISDKHIFDRFLQQIQLIDLTTLNSNILKLLTNLSYSKHNKSLFVTNKQLHKTIMGIATGGKASREHRRWILQLLYNMLYKSAAAIRIYKRKEVIEELRYVRENQLGEGSEEKETLGRILEILESDYN